MRRLGLGLVIAAGMPIGCALHVDDLRAADRPARGEDALIGITPEQAARTNPVPAGPEALQAGGELFSRACVPCHGDNGKGKGKIARSLDLRPPDFTKRRQQEKRSDGELFYILTHGHRAMPGQGDRWEDELKWNLIHYIRSFGPE